MPRPQPDIKRRTLTLETQRRSIDIPTDSNGHLRRARALPTLHRAADGTAVPGVRGHALTFGQRTWIGSKRWGYWEQIERGATLKTINEKRTENADIVLNRDHDNRLLLARTSNGTLRLEEDDSGLAVDADIGDYSYARDVITALERRDLTGMSFAFDVITWEWSIADDGNDLLTLRELELFDVAVVGMPAYPQTDASLRSDILAACRAHGFDFVEIGLLAERLADPDDELITAFRALARGAGGRPAPAETTQERSDDSEHSPPAETTGNTSTTRALAFATLALATQSLKEM